MSESDRAFQRSVNEAIAFGIDNISKLSPVATGLKALFGPTTTEETPEESTGGPTRMQSLLSASREEKAMQDAIAEANADTGLVANPMSVDPSQRVVSTPVVTAPIVEVPAITEGLLSTPIVETPVEVPSPVVTAPIVEVPAITEGLLSTPIVETPVEAPAPTEAAPIAAPAPAAETAQQKQDRENFESAQAWQRERDAYLLTLAPTLEEGAAIDRYNIESAAAWQREQDRANYESAVARQKAQTESDLETQRLLNRYPAPTGGGESQRGGESVGGYSGVNTSRATSGQFGMDPSTRGQYAKGGYVSMQHLNGPDPMGPDDGYAALKDGEFVINDKAVKKYGIELMNAINSGKIKKGKLLGLLEM